MIVVKILLFSGSLMMWFKCDNFTIFYYGQMSSDGPTHNEFDFEFLGNTTGEPYSVQTNLYINGVGNREQRLKLWFDPTTDFHAYSILWTPRKVL